MSDGCDLTHLERPFFCVFVCMCVRMPAMRAIDGINHVSSGIKAL
jgi:hypothetical protein